MKQLLHRPFFTIYKAIYYALIPGVVRENLAFLPNPRHLRTDVLIVSYPKCGRTWLKVLLGKIFNEYYGLDFDENLIVLPDFHRAEPEIPFIVFTHDQYRSYMDESDEEPNPESYYAGKDLVYMFRDPRDVAVSWYHQLSKRTEEYDGSLSDFISDDGPVPGVIIQFYNKWARKIEDDPDIQTIRYESLHNHPIDALEELMGFLGYPDISRDLLRTADRFASFENMREMEEEQKFNTGRLQPNDPDDPDSYKTRKGEVGGYTEELTDEQVKFLNDRFRSDLHDYYSQFYDFSGAGSP